MANRSPTEELRELRAAGPERGRQPSLTQTWAPGPPALRASERPLPAAGAAGCGGRVCRGDACAGQRCWRSELRFLHLCLQTLVAAPTHSHAPRGPSDSEWPEVTHSPSFPQTPGLTQPRERPTGAGQRVDIFLSAPSLAAEAERTFPQEARPWQPRPLARCVMGTGL